MVEESGLLTVSVVDAVKIDATDLETSCPF